MGQNILNASYECWEDGGKLGVQSWAIVGINKMEEGKGLFCAQSRGFGKVYN